MEGKYQLYVCKICGEPYLGNGAPTKCPFCGAQGEMVVPSEKWTPLWGEPINAISRKHLEIGLALEISSTNFYMNVSKSAKDVYSQKLFKGLSKVEREHASTMCKIMGIPTPEIDKMGTPADAPKANLHENLLESNRRETGAVAKYQEAAAEVTDGKVKLLFLQLIKIESDHLLLSEKEKEKP